MNNLLLLSGNDIPFPSMQLVIHTPSIKEIGYIGEDDFYTGCSMLNFSRNKFLNEQDKIDLKDTTDFDIFMLVIQNKEMQKVKNSVIAVLQLLFPDFQINILSSAIFLTNYENSNDVRIIDNNCFKEFQSILVQLFCLQELDTKEEETYSGDLARKIAAKLEAGRKKVAQMKGEKGKKISILSYYISILAVGQQKDMNQLLNYSVYQLYDEFKRYMRKNSYDEYVKMVLAGAKNVEKVDNWLKNSEEENKN